MSTTSEEIKYAQRSNHMEEDVPLSRQMTIQISPEQYERLFFQPTPARGDLAKRVGMYCITFISRPVLTSIQVIQPLLA